MTPPRRPGSVRRTTTHSSARPEGLEGPVSVRATGRDLRTDVDGRTEALDQVDVRMTVDGKGTVTGFESEPADGRLHSLIGHTAYSGFRAAAREITSTTSPMRDLRDQLLDDVPIALMLSGRVLRVNGISLGLRSERSLPIDICAGWVEGGTLLAGYTELGPPIERGPVAEAVQRKDDPLAWHDDEELGPNATRRRRRLDVWIEDGVGRVDSFFRDTFADQEGLETVVHQYGLRADVDLEAMCLLSCTADPGPLPYPECPGAAASAARLADVPLSDLRRMVPVTLTGPPSCTHLNDALRALEDVETLLHALGGVNLPQRYIYAPKADL